MRKIKVLALLAVSVIAATACAGNASASEFEAGETGKAISATTLATHTITLTGSKVECTTTKFEGTTEWNGSETLKVHPVYEGCKAFGFSSTITTKGCDYEFNANTTSSMGGLSIIDHAGETCNGIVITTDPIGTTCTAVIPKQTLSSAVSYTNNSGKIKVKATASEIKANVTASTGFCPLATGSHSGAGGGSYSGESEASAAGTTLEWWEQNAVKPKFGVYNKPAGLVWKAGETKEIKVEDEGAAGENWTLRNVFVFQTGNNWEGSEEANCANKNVVGGSGFKCEWKVKCKSAGEKAYVVVSWTNSKGRKDQSFYGPMECP